MFNKFAFSILLLSFPLTIFAHGGHGFFHGYELAHYLTSPIHAIPIYLAVGIAVWIFIKRKSKDTSL